VARAGEKASFYTQEVRFHALFE